MSLKVHRADSGETIYICYNFALSFVEHLSAQKDACKGEDNLTSKAGQGYDITAITHGLCGRIEYQNPLIHNGPEASTSPEVTPAQTPFTLVTKQLLLSTSLFPAETCNNIVRVAP